MPYVLRDPQRTDDAVVEEDRRGTCFWSPSDVIGVISNSPDGPRSFVSQHGSDVIDIDDPLPVLPNSNSTLIHVRC